MPTLGHARGPGHSIVQGILPIERSQIPSEIVAGLTLGAIAIPEVMGYTKISGTPVITGLYTILIPTALFAVFGSSRHLVVGADSATAAILAAALVGMAATGSSEYVELACVLALMAAGFLILARLFRLGFMADFLSRTVMIGFLTGVGVQVAAGQLAGMMGIKGQGHRLAQKIWNDVEQIDHINYYALTTALIVLVVIVSLKKISKKIPAPLIAVVVAIIVSWAMDLQAHMEVLGTVPGGLPRIGLPQVSWSWELVQTLIPTAFAMFVVILTQSAATSRAYAAKYNEAFSENVDLVGLAFANIGAGLSGAFVVNGSPTKTQIVDSAGGRTQLSLLVTVAMVLLVLLFVTAPLDYLPEAVLSAIVFRIGIDLIDVRGMRRVFVQRQPEFWIASITAVTVAFIGVEQGILLAMVLSLVEHTRRGYRPKNSLLVMKEAGEWDLHPVATGLQALPGLFIYRFTHSMYYANSQRLSDEITSLIGGAETPVRWFCIEASAVDDVDYTAADVLRSIFASPIAKDVRFVIAGVRSEVAAESRYGLIDLIGPDALYNSTTDVVKDYQRQAETPTAKVAVP
jgi:high affinity sulfate transporter 1